jgi:hypothetical protein
MRLSSALLALVAACAVLTAQYPVGIGTDNTAAITPGVVAAYNWYTHSPSGCTNGPGLACVGTDLLGDSHFFSAWLPNSSGLPVTSGLPIVGSMNDYNFPYAGGCDGNIMLVQLAVFSWSTPDASAIAKVNCMSGFGASSGTQDTPAGWYGMGTGSQTSPGASWKSRAPVSHGGILYLPVERQVSSGLPIVHDATIMMSPDSGAHWCNPNTYYAHSGSPGCDSSNWSATGDAPICGAASTGTACLNSAYTDSTHSSMMWKALPIGTEGWSPVQWGVQDGASLPAGAGVSDGLDPTTYSYWTLFSGSGGQYGALVARIPWASVLDKSSVEYYTCSTLTPTTHCYGGASGSWTSTLSSATTLMHLTYSGGSQNGVGEMRNPYQISYLSQFNSYVALGQGGELSWSPSMFGPWRTVWRGLGFIQNNFWTWIPALGVTSISSDPPKISISTVANSYDDTDHKGTPQFVKLELALGRSGRGDAPGVNIVKSTAAGDGLVYTDSHQSGTMPRRGLVYGFDLHDQYQAPGSSDWPYWMDRGNYAGVLTSCLVNDSGTETQCGAAFPTHGTSVADAAITQSDSVSTCNSRFRIAPADGRLLTIGTVPALEGNSSYTLMTAIKIFADTPFSRDGGVFTYGLANGAVDNTMLSLDQRDRNFRINWNSIGGPHYQFLSTFTATTNNWYFIALTVQAGTVSCGSGSGCAPTAHLWVGGLTTAGKLGDALAGVSMTNSPQAATTKTPAVASGPFWLGNNQNGCGGYQSYASFASLGIYSVALSQAEVNLAYKTMTTNLAKRGITLQ